MVAFSLREKTQSAVPKPAQAAGPPIEIPTRLARPHHLVAELKAAAEGASEDGGVLVLNFRKVLRVRTSGSQLRRALILLDTLIKQFEKQGHTVRLSEKNAETELVLKEGVVSFRLDERTRRIDPPPPPPKPPGRRGEHYHEPWRPAYILAGTGEFTLEFNRYALRGCRKTWKDGVRRSLEAQLSDVLAAIPSWDAAMLESRLQREDREARAREAEKARIAAARANELLRIQRRALANNLRAWERAERLRRFIAAFEQLGDRSPEADTWVAWAHAQVQALDPLSEPAVVTDLSVELSGYFTGHGSWEKPTIDWWTVPVS